MASLLALWALACTALWQPFTWDQAVFALGADAMERGGHLYRDYWDLKQPGIFWFFLLARRWFGVHEAGAHALEIAWMLVLAAAMQWQTRRWFRSAYTAAWCPWLVVGAYFTFCNDWHLLQVEGLVGLPMFLAVRLFVSDEAGRIAPPPRAVAAGIAAGVVLVFKLALAPVLLAAWLLAAASGLRATGPARRATALALVAAATGIGSVWAGVIADLLLHRNGALAWSTWFALPARVIAEMPKGLPLDALRHTAHWLAFTWWPLLLPAALGAFVSWRAREPFGRALVMWFVAGVAVILMQRWSGYEYHLLLLLVPMGLLAARAIEHLSALAATAAPRIPALARRAALAALVLAWFVAPLLDAGGQLHAMAQARVWRDVPARDAFLESNSQGGLYKHYRVATGFLDDPGALPGPIYVFGNPLTYWISGRVPAAARPGGMSIFNASEWQEVTDDIAQNKPAYILVEDTAGDMLLAHRPATDSVMAMIHARYHRMGRVAEGRWFERNDPVANAAP
jgi:hypothetical protein